MVNKNSKVLVEGQVFSPPRRVRMWSKQQAFRKASPSIASWADATLSFYHSKI